MDAETCEHNKAKKATKRPREELHVLAEEVCNRKSIIYTKFTDIVTKEKKMKCWRQNTCKVNAVSVTARDVDKIRKKWTDWSSTVNMNASKYKDDFNKTELEENVMQWKALL